MSADDDSRAYGQSLMWEADRRYLHDPAFKALARQAMHVVDMDAHAHGRPLTERDRQLVISGIALGLIQAERRPTPASSDSQDKPERP